MKIGKFSEFFRLDDKSALVTGGAMGIGEAIALRLAQAGAAVSIVDVAPEAEKVVAAIKDFGGRAQWVRCDLTNVAEVTKAVEQATRTFKNLEVVVNNAGIFPMSPFLETNENLWDKVMAVNLRAPFFMAQAAAKKMILEKHGGVIINIASIDAEHPSGALAHYDASKGGLVMMTRALAAELAPHAIRVNAIEPGGVSTPGVQKSTGSTSTGSIPDDVLKAFTARIPLKRMGEPDDIARAVLFLATDASSYMTGSTVVIDGGYLLS